MCVPEHLSGGSGAIVGQLWGGGQGRVGHLLDVGVRGRRLGRFLLAECLFERAAQLQRYNKMGRDGERTILKNTPQRVRGVGCWGRWRRKAVKKCK